MNRLGAILNLFLDRLEEWLIATLIGAATVVTFIAVVHRYGASNSAGVARWAGTHGFVLLHQAADWTYTVLAAVNISWALIADRSSCFAGSELALTFAPLPADRREAINAQFTHLFAGQGTPQDAGDLATEYGCDVVIVVPQDGAWKNDPFAASPDYRLVESREDQWRIYVKSAPKIGN